MNDVHSSDLVHLKTIVPGQQTASRSLEPEMFVAAWVNPVGTSGQPEIDLGCLPIAEALVEPLLARLQVHADAFEHTNPAAARAWLKALPPVFSTKSGFADSSGRNGLLEERPKSERSEHRKRAPND